MKYITFDFQKYADECFIIDILKLFSVTKLHNDENFAKHLF